MGSTTPRIREVLRAGHDRLILCLYSFVLGCSRATSRLFLPAVNWQYLIRYLNHPSCLSCSLPKVLSTTSSIPRYLLVVERLLSQALSHTSELLSKLVLNSIQHGVLSTMPRIKPMH